MSSTLTWKPARTRGASLPYELKKVLEKKHDFPWTVGASQRDYFVALMDAEIPGAKDVVDAIDEHGEIDLVKCY